MNHLIKNIQRLQHSPIQQTVQQRIQDFKNINRFSAEDLFKELCFCILTANFNAERTMHIHSHLKDCFCSESKEVIAQQLKAHGYRFPNTRAAHITESRLHKNQLPLIINTYGQNERRTWLANNIKGFGQKESSHFLRNIGFDDYAIIDSHILDLLERNHLITKPKTLTPTKYKEIETILHELARQTNLTVAALDLYLWYLETGKILK
jgi:N-glycosylase/DNA lyase